MRLEEYINEDMLEQYSDIVPSENLRLIRTNCKKYLRLMKNTRSFYRGVYDRLGNGKILKKRVRQNRKPMATSNTIFKKLNSWLKKHGHTRRDQSVSVISDAMDAAEFGEPYFFFPIGNFNYTWIRATDLNLDDYKTSWKQIWVNIVFNQSNVFDKSYTEYVKKEFPTYFTTNKGIEIAHKNKYEIWFDCKEYYVLNPSTKNTYWSDD